MYATLNSMMANQLQKRFDAAWKKATDEHSRLVLKFGWPSAVPEAEWTRYNKLLNAANRIADEAGPVGSAAREKLVYGER